MIYHFLSLLLDYDELFSQDSMNSSGETWESFHIVEAELINYLLNPAETTKRKFSININSEWIWEKFKNFTLDKLNRS